MEKQKLTLSNNSYSYLYKWKVSKPKAILHLIHGSIEHIGRYKDMIKFLNSKGISVYGMDLRGHGVSSFEQGVEGHFSNFKWAFDDIDKVNQIIKSENKNVNIVMYGHSMGSFVLRYYMHYNKSYDVILSGTNFQRMILTIFGIFLLKMTILFKGKKKINKLIYNISYKSFDKKMPAKSSWLSNNVDIVKNYNEDKLNKFKFTNESFLNIFKWLKVINSRKAFKNYKGRILITSGKIDPVGNFGKGPQKIYCKFIKNNANARLKIWENRHHEIHNDNNKKDIYNLYVNFILNKKYES